MVITRWAGRFGRILGLGAVALVIVAMVGGVLWFYEFLVFAARLEVFY